MWRGHEAALYWYGVAICKEWTGRGYRDTCLDKLLVEIRKMPFHRYPPPPWLGDPDFHRSHQSNLVRKDPGYYRPYFPDVPDDLPYVWPVP